MLILSAKSKQNVTETQKQASTVSPCLISQVWGNWQMYLRCSAVQKKKTLFKPEPVLTIRKPITGVYMQFIYLCTFSFADNKCKDVSDEQPFPASLNSNNYSPEKMQLISQPDSAANGFHDYPLSVIPSFVFL